MKQRGSEILSPVGVLTFFCLLVFVALGCFPYQFTVEPGVKGLLVDARTGLPIPGAEIALRTRKGEANTVTSDDGGFRIDAKQNWGIVIAPFDSLHYDCTVSIEASGYDSATMKFRTSSTGPAVTDLGTVHLTPTTVRN
jgi:hypothetical protein